MQELGLPADSREDRHREQGSAREYEGHLASVMDKPSKTLRAGCNGPGGGSNTVLLHDGTVRYFTIREMARLQSFPDSYLFDPVWSHAVKEIGNACPPAMLQPWLVQLLPHCRAFPLTAVRSDRLPQLLAALYCYGNVSSASSASDEETASSPRGANDSGENGGAREPPSVNAARGVDLAMQPVPQAPSTVLYDVESPIAGDAEFEADAPISEGPPEIFSQSPLYVRNSEAVVIAPRSEARFNVYVPAAYFTRPEFVGCRNVMLTPLDEGVLHDLGVLTSATVKHIDESGGTLCVVINPSLDQVTIPPHTAVGLCTRVRHAAPPRKG